MRRVSKEIVSIASEGVRKRPEMSAIVLKSTDLPPYAGAINEAAGLPIFDFISMMEHVAVSLGKVRLY